jgi:hypothetical protein
MLWPVLSSPYGPPPPTGASLWRLAYSGPSSGLMLTPERSSFTGRTGVCCRMQRLLSESEDAAAARHVALLGYLLAWAKVQSTIFTPCSAAWARPWQPTIQQQGLAAPRRRHCSSSASTTAAALALCGS